MSGTQCITLSYFPRLTSEETGRGLLQQVKPRMAWDKEAATDTPTSPVPLIVLDPKNFFSQLGLDMLWEVSMSSSHLLTQVPPVATLLVPVRGHCETPHNH